MWRIRTIVNWYLLIWSVSRSCSLTTAIFWGPPYHGNTQDNIWIQSYKIYHFQYPSDLDSMHIWTEYNWILIHHHIINLPYLHNWQSVFWNTLTNFPKYTQNHPLLIPILSMVQTYYIGDGEVQEHWIVNSSHKHHIMIGITLKDSIQHGY